MSDTNPWRKFPHETYEKHMGHENVKQLEMLSRIFASQLTLAATITKPVIAVLGITSGNGLENIKKDQYKSIIGMDINEEFLDICKEKYGYLPELELYKIDLMTEKERAVNILRRADLLTANLLIKHIHLENFMDIVRDLEKTIVSVTIQFNPDGQPVSHSGFESAFDEIQNHGQDCDEDSLTSAMTEADYKVIGREEYILPNNKIFIRLDYKRHRETMAVSIRLAVPADAPDMAEIHMRSWEAAYAGIIPDDYIREKNATRPALFKRIITDENNTQYVIQTNGKTVGILCVAPPQDEDLGDDVYEVHGIYLHPDYYRKGIGTQAMNFALDLTKQKDKKSMVLWVFKDNINSRNFYEKCGFSYDGAEKELICGKPLTAVRYRREI